MSGKQAALAFALLWAPAVLGAVVWTVLNATYEFLFWWSGSDVFAGAIVYLTVSGCAASLFGFGMFGTFDAIPPQFKALWRRLA